MRFALEGVSLEDDAPKPVLTEPVASEPVVLAPQARPSALLFACRMNAIRSPMAAAITRQMFPGQIYTQSAGVRPGALDPFVQAVMDEIGIDISSHKPHTFEELEDTNFDLIITLAPEAHHKAMELTRTNALEVEYWPMQDPSLATGSREQILDSYRAIRDELARRIRERFS
ncbi:MAG: protein-tyrosine-phosphatase [Hyphomicrobiales bacterium]|nr:arsenate reductase ArsC [Hyphomicrobiales bacterium]PCJ88488.1 MAG: protein-tyrosine-phosphatase [Hyphomicrobiales bacterium]